LRGSADLSNVIVVSNTPRRNPLARLQTLLTIVCAVWLLAIGYDGFREMQVWSQASTITGKLVAVVEVPRKKFFDLGPERLRRFMPYDRTRRRQLYRVSYLDRTGRAHEATLEAAEFYVPPHEEVELAYVDGDPPQVKGLARARDSAFLDQMPKAIGVGILYVVGISSIRFLPGLLGLLLKITVPKARNVDPDRPELH
jgi:hypothetical protein